ncbi:hypothetical protein DXG01_010185 [Tephrocybe rancida]|nr:hypothetical protein DXG01_010185 [Tephrocybe rancida]
MLAQHDPRRGSCHPETSTPLNCLLHASADFSDPYAVVVYPLQHGLPRERDDTQPTLPLTSLEEEIRPGTLGSRQYLDSEEAELAKRTYAVRDCFQDIVLNTKKRGSEPASCRIQTLAALCSIVIGDNMEDQDGKNEPNNDDEGEDEDEEYFSNPIDDIYEAIPAEYRRFTLLLHALKLICTQCGDNVTLLAKLLDVTLDHNLNYESTYLLHSLVCLALTSEPPSAVPAICHSTHSNFFYDLYTQWTTSGSPEPTFFRILIDALEESRNHSAWASRAVNSVAQVICIRDFASYLRLISVISVLAAELTASLPEVKNPVQSRILSWLKALFERLPSAAKAPDWGPAMASYHDDICKMLLCVLPLVCNPRVPEPPGSLVADLQGIVLSLSTQWLAMRQLPSHNLIDELSMSLPHASTFTPLVAKVFVESGGSLQTFRTMIENLSATLSLPSLLHLNASLLACVLLYIEYPSRERELAARSSAAEIRDYRHHLIRLADEAEDRFVRPRAKPSIAQSFTERSCVIATPLRREMFKDISEWEPRSGVWLRRSEDRRSARKKRKLNSSHCNSREVALPFGPSAGSNHSQTIVQDSKGRTPTFSALLSSAASKRAILHPVQKLPCVRSQSEARDIGFGDSENSDDELQPVSFSDDALDLFGWASSSPAVKNRRL